MLGKILKKPTAADLVSAINRARGVVDEKRSMVADAEAAVATALAELDAAGHAKATADLAAARAMLEAAKEFATAAEARHAEAAAAEAEDAWRREATAHDRAVAAFEKDTRTALGEMGEAARRIVGRSRELEIRWRDLNSRRPADAEPAKHPEFWRTVPGGSEEIVSETIEERWFDEGADRPLAASVAATVIAAPGGRTGTRHTWGGTHVSVVKRRVRRRVIRERSSPIHAEPLAAALSVPGATAGDRPGWRPTEPDLVATALEALAAPRSKPERPTREVVDILE